MADVIEIFRGMPDFIGSTGRSEEEIADQCNVSLQDVKEILR